MANTTNINHTQWDGSRGLVHLNISSDGTALSDLSVLDISTLAPAPDAVKIRTIFVTLWGNFELALEFDATTDEKFAHFKNQTADVSFSDFRDFTDAPSVGWVPDKTATGFTGDILATSTGLANLDGFDLVISFESS